MHATPTTNPASGVLFKATWLCGAILFSLGLGPQAIAASPGDEVIEEVVVTGSYIKRTSQQDSASPLTNVDRQSIDDTGILTSQEIFRWLPSNTGSENQADALTQGDTPGTSNVNLRGLGLGSTLVLLNGRRQTVSSATADRGDSFVDLNSLVPMIMIDNIEILKDGAAAIYGSDAVAGVVNYKTRDEFEGFEIRANYQATSDSDDHQDSEISALWGTGGEATRFVFALKHFDRQELELKDRDLDTKTTSSFGNPGSFLPLAASPTITSAVPGVFNADPACDSATGSFTGPADPDTGQTLCFFDFGPSFSLVPDEKRNQAFATVDHSVNDRLNFHGEFGWAKNEIGGGYSPSFPILSFPRVAADHPGNPFDVPVVARFRAIGDGLGSAGGNRVNNFANHETTRIVLGIDGDLGSTNWDYELAYTFSESTLASSANDQSKSRLELALAGFGGFNCNPLTGTAGVGDCLYFNPFGTALSASAGDPEYNSSEVIEFINSRNTSRIDSDLVTWDLIVSGDIFETRAGTAGLAVGLQRREESRDADLSDDANRGDLVFLLGDPDSSVYREVDAIFAELFMPLVDADFGTLEAQLALRYEDYDTGFDSTDPKIGLLYRSQDGNVSARFTYSSSFRAPTIFQQFVTDTSLSATRDPLTGSRVFLGETASPNSALEAEEADTFNVGVTIQPIDNLSISVDYWNVEFENRISQESGQDLITAESAALTAANCGPTQLTTARCAPLTNSQIIRDEATGTPLRIFVNRFNASSAETDGFDLSASYRWDKNYSMFSLINDTTFVSSFDLQATAGGATIRGAGKRNENNTLASSIPEIRSNTVLGWNSGPHNANLILRYIDDYEDTADTIDDWWVFYVQYSFAMEILADQQATITVGALNLTDEEPPAVSGDTNEFGYDTKVHDPRGRMLYTRLVYNF